MFPKPTQKRMKGTQDVSQKQFFCFFVFPIFFPLESFFFCPFLESIHFFPADSLGVVRAGTSLSVAEKL